VKLVDTGLLIGDEGFTKYQDKRFNPNMKLTSTYHLLIYFKGRLFPHVHNMDGFFIAKLKKIADGSKK
jgi:ribosomal RNA methyltransferase Nop2